MTIDLPLESQRWPWARLLTRKSWGGDATSGGGWTAQIMQRPEPESTGFVLLGYQRALLPQLGTATLQFRYGRIGSRVTGASAASATRQRQGSGWDSSTDTTSPPDLTDLEIRIQIAPRGLDEEPSSLNWKDVFWGTCEYQTDDAWGAADEPAGERTYHCVDALHRLKRWPLNRHGFYGDGQQVNNAKGHPGYNVSPQTPGQVAGDRESTGVTFATPSGSTAFAHTYPGSGTTWTDEQVINHALAVSRPPGEPLFTLSGAVELFASANSWRVNEGDTAWDLLIRICDRSRGRGAVRVEWNDGSADGPLTAALKAYAQLADNITVQLTTGSETVQGATARGTAVEVDLIGDHRLEGDSFKLSEAKQYQVGYLESQGEPIEVLTTLGMLDGTLVKGWKDSEATTFRGLDADKRQDKRWLPVYQLYRLQRGFFGSVKNGNNGGPGRMDYRCDDNGVISEGSGPADTSPLTIEVMDDLPIFQGYNYQGTPTRFDGDTAATYAGTPMRSAPLVFIRTKDDYFLAIEELDQPFSVRFGPDGFLVVNAQDDSAGTRYIGDKDESTLQSVYDADQVVITVGIRLPHRVRMATGKPDAKRKLVLRHPDIHVWKAHPGAIWDLDTTTRDGSDGSNPKRNAGGASGLLRDDRDALARLHALAVAWYGPLFDLLGTHSDEPARRGASWTLRCCGDVPSSQTYDGGNVVYPDVGKVVTTIAANGQQYRLMTPVSSFAYDHIQGTTTWTTDWTDLDMPRA